MKQTLRRGALSALLALAVLPAAAQAAFTPTVSISTVAAGCGPQGAYGFAGPGANTGAVDLAANAGYVYNITAITGSTETNPCVNVTVPVGGVNNSSDSAILSFLSVPGATAYKIYRGGQTLQGPGAGGSFPAAALCLATNAGNRCNFQDNGNFTSVAGAPPALPAATSQAGSSPDLRIAQAFDYGDTNGDPNTSTDDPAANGSTTNSASLRTNILHFPSGLAANPSATTTRCKLSGAAPSFLGDIGNPSTSTPAKTGSRDPDEDTCPRSSQVGTVVALIQTATGPSLAGGDIYLGERLGSETARLYVALRPLCSNGSVFAPGGSVCNAILPAPGLEVDKSFLSAKATIKQDGATQVVTIDNETTSIASGSDESLAPFSVVKVKSTGAVAANSPIQVRSITQTLFGNADQGTAATGDDKNFILLPTSCAAETFGVDASSYLDQANVNASAALQATSCDAVAFSPTISGKLDVSGGEQGENGHPAFEATISQAAGEAAQKTAQVTLPNGLGTNITAVGNACTQAELASAGGCPAKSQVGTVSATSPLLGQLAGPVFLVQSNGGALPDLVVNLNGDGASVRLRGAISFNGDQTRLVNTFDKIPDTPLSSFKLSISGGPNGLLSNARDLCTSPLGNIDASFTGQNGKQTSQSVAVDQSSLANCVYYYITPPGTTAKAKKPSFSIKVRGIKKNRPSISALIKRGGTNKRDNLRRTKLTLAKGLSFRKGKAAKNRVIVKVNGKRTRKFSIKGRVLRIDQSSSTARRVAIGTKRGALKETRKLHRQGKKKKLTFKLVQRVQGGRTFRITKKVKPRS